MLTARQWLTVAILGLCGVAAYNICYFNGLKLIDAGRAAVIVATSPIFIAIASAALLRERFSQAGIFGVAVSFCGAAIVISRGNLHGLLAGGFGLGELFIFGAVLCWGAYTIMGRFIMAHVSPIVAVAYSCVFGTAFLLVPAFMEGVPNFSAYTTGTWGALAYMVIFATVLAYIWFYQGVKRIGAARAGLFLNFVPVCGVLLAYLFLRESVTPSLAVGALFVLTGVCLINRKRASPVRQPSAA